MRSHVSMVIQCLFIGKLNEEGICCDVSIAKDREDTYIWVVPIFGVSPYCKCRLSDVFDKVRYTLGDFIVRAEHVPQ